MFKQSLSAEQIEQAVAEALGGAGAVAAVEELGEGTFNAAYAVRLVDGRTVVLKVAPPPGAPLLTYEQGLLHTEALCLRTFAERTHVPHPRLLAAGLGPTSIGREYLVTSALAGASWSSQIGRITPADRRVLRRQLGRHVAALHTVTGPGPFGYATGGELLLYSFDDAFPDQPELPHGPGQYRVLVAARGRRESAAAGDEASFEVAIECFAVWTWPEPWSPPPGDQVDRLPPVSHQLTRVRHGVPAGPWWVSRGIESPLIGSQDVPGGRGICGTFLARPFGPRSSGCGGAARVGPPPRRRRGRIGPGSSRRGR